MKYNLNRLKLLALAGLILFVGFIFTWSRFVNIGKPGTPTENQDTTTTPVQKSYVNLLVDFGNGKVVTYENVEARTNESPYSLVVKKMNETGSNVATKKFSQGIMVESIDNVAASSEFFWSYSVNGQAGSVAADKYILKNGDSVEWRYTKIQ